MSDIIRQGDLDFSVGFKLQTTWGLREALVFSLEGISGSVFACFLLLDNAVGMVIAVAVMVLAALLLLSHLGHPEKAWRAPKMVRNSWISRGTIIISLFLVSSLGYLSLKSIEAINLGHSVDVISKITLIGLALLVMTYPGLILSKSPSIPFWNSGLMPILFLLSSITSGISVISVYLSQNANLISQSILSKIVLLQSCSLFFLLVCVIMYVVSMNNSGAAAKESAQMLIRGKLALRFILVTCVIGVVVPLVLTAAIAAGGAYVGIFLGASVITRLAGDISLKQVLIEAGMYEPIF